MPKQLTDYPCDACGAQPGEQCVTIRSRWSRRSGFSKPGKATSPHTSRVSQENQDWLRQHGDDRAST